LTISHPNQAQSSPPFSTSEPKLAAAGLALGGTLEDVDDDGGRLTFFIGGISPTFLTDVMNDRVTVSVKQFIAAMDSILSLIAERRRGRSWR
jgi:hypothetical protein